MTLKIYAWQDAVTELRSLWIDMVVARNLNPSLHPDWLDTTLHSHGLHQRAQVLLVETTRGEQAIVPVIPRRVAIGGVPFRCLDLCSNVLSYHAGLIATGGHADVLNELAMSPKLPAWDVLRLGNLVATEATAESVNGLDQLTARVRTYDGERSPYIAMTSDFPQFLGSLPKKMRANITRCIRVTQQAGETGMRWYEHDADTDQLLSDVLEIESKSWKAANHMAIKGDTAEGRYYQRLLPWLRGHGLMANVLYVKERPAAYVLCARWQGWVGQLKTSFDNDIRDAGFRVIHASIERAYSNRETEYDFLGDEAPHKTRWANQIRAHEHKWLFARHYRGRMLFHLKRTIDAWRRHHARSSSPSLPTETVGAT
jgi:CelD/BcsL family acetyltransferase involved in cellulose biosynthesis